MTYLTEAYDIAKRTRSVDGTLSRPTIKQSFTSEDYVSISHGEKLAIHMVNSNETHPIFYYIADSNGNIVVVD